MTRIFLLLTALAISTVAGAQAIKVSTAAAAYSTNATGGSGHSLGLPAAKLIQREFDQGAVVYFMVNVLNAKAIKAKSRLELVVFENKDGKESYNYHYDFNIPTKNSSAAIYTEFREGDYTVKIRDKDNQEDIYTSASFSIMPKAKIDYRNNSTFVICKSVDDNWMPVGQTAKFKAGECVNFLYKAKDRMNFITLVWDIVRVKADGTEEPVDVFRQGFGFKPYRFACTTQGVCSFNTPGKYRVYLFDKDNHDTRHDEDSNYLGKTEFTVE